MYKIVITLDGIGNKILLNKIQIHFCIHQRRTNCLCCVGSAVANIGYLYMGCYRDISYPRMLSGFQADYPETLTPQHCVTVCKQKGFLFAGLQIG